MTMNVNQNKLSVWTLWTLAFFAQGEALSVCGRLKAV